MIRDFWRENTKMIMMMMTTTTSQRRRRGDDHDDDVMMMMMMMWREISSSHKVLSMIPDFWREKQSISVIWYLNVFFFFSNFELEQCNSGGFKLHKAILKAKDTKCSHMATT